ncbi:MAG: hypothetical protein O2877_02720 [bacterium]|nr:hypothetical protein [bacterium]
MRTYRRIALSFVIITAAILVAVIYASLIRATIRITPIEQAISSSFLVDVSAQPIEDGEVRGRVLERSIDISDRFQVSTNPDNASPIEGKASGMVTITNGRATSQQLVATTRFLAEDGTLFRLNEGVNVPAGGFVDARITADKPGVAGDIAPGHFTIPGLSTSVQEIVYGETVEAMTGGLSYVNVLTQEDLDAAVASLQNKALENVQQEMRDQVGVFEGEAFVVEPAERRSDTQPGVEASTFNVGVTFRVVGVFFDNEELYKLAESALYQDIEKGLRPVGVDTSALSFSIDRYDSGEETATLRVELSGHAIPSAAHHALSRGVFSGMTADDVIQYFNENKLAETVEVDIRPFWRNKVPRSPNKIKLLISE